MIALKNIDKNFLTPLGNISALSNINLHVNRGEIFGIIGKSGAGKSTLIRCINLLEKPNKGRVIVADEDLMQLSATKLREARRKIGMIFQHFNLLTARTVYDNIAFPLELIKKSRKEIETIITPLLEITGLADKKKNYPAQLSGGQKQRVAIARALACQPHVLLSDEATSSLDPETTTAILQLLKNIRDAFNITILLITHEMSVIKTCCDRVGILHHGQLVEENEIGEFFARPKTAIAKNFILSSLPQHLPSILESHILSKEQQNTHPLLRLVFTGNAATQPIISQLINSFHLRVNILQANVEYIRKHAMGTMVIAINGEKNNIHAAMEHLNSLGVQVEMIGYISNDIIAF
jgi:D-methionine transport system ATP-binding protein